MKRLLGLTTTAVALVLAGCGGSSTRTVTVTSSSPSGGTGTSPVPIPTGPASSTTASPGTSSSASTSAVPATTVHLATFRSPSGNIGCMIIAGTARCDIRKRSWSPPPRPPSCSNVVDFGQGLIVTGTGPGHLVCAGDTSLDPSARVLPYNYDTVAAGFRCASRTDGVTCANTRTGHGFAVAIQGYRTF